MNYKDPDYHKRKSKEHYEKNKETIKARNQAGKDRTRVMFSNAKASGCTAPGCSEREPVCLDFHHLEGKDMLVSKMLGMNDARVAQEIAKCIILCANCHRKVHAGIITI
jgi:5-methylcytosine-specific restriction endonuclease McrA